MRVFLACFQPVCEVLGKCVCEVCTSVHQGEGICLQLRGAEDCTGAVLVPGSVLNLSQALCHLCCLALHSQCLPVKG